MIRILKYYKKWITVILSGIVLLPGSASITRAAFPVYRSVSSGSLTFYFANSSSMLMRDYRTNEIELAKLDRFLQTPAITSALDSIVIHGASSVIGSFRINERLAGERAASVQAYIRWKHPRIDPGKILIAPSVFNWEELRERIQQDQRVPYREEVLHILASPLSDESKAMQIKELGNGSTGNYITGHLARYMRSATSLFFYLNEEPGEETESETAEQVLDSASGAERETIAVYSVEEPASSQMDDPGQESATDREEAAFVAPFAVMERKPLFAVKTNLLYDLGSALNLQMEVPIGQRWSMAGEWIFPWWLWEKKQYALEIFNGNVEGRYWWGDRVWREPMTGWFTGIYAGGGYYDVEWKTKGYQGEFLSAGFTGGFAHRIGWNWRMEYSLGLGYLGSKYREYVPETMCGDDQWHLIRQRHGHFNWVGPTQAKVSLVWMIHQGYRKKGGQ